MSFKLLIQACEHTIVVLPNFILGTSAAKNDNEVPISAREVSFWAYRVGQDVKTYDQGEPAVSYKWTG